MQKLLFITYSQTVKPRSRQK